MSESNQPPSFPPPVPVVQEPAQPAAAEPAGKKCCCCVPWSESTWAFLLLRVWLAVRALVTGIDKYAVFKTESRPKMDPITGMEDLSGAMETIRIKTYALSNYHGIDEKMLDAFKGEPIFKPFPWMLDLYVSSLGPALIILALTLLFGICTRISLVLMGLLYTSLTFGLLLYDFWIPGPDGQGAVWFGTHMLLIVAALVLAKHNKLAILKKF